MPSTSTARGSTTTGEYNNIFSSLGTFLSIKELNSLKVYRQISLSSCVPCNISSADALDDDHGEVQHV